MTRKPFLLAVLIAVLAIAGWWLAREFRSRGPEPGPAPLPAAPLSDARAESDLTQPAAGEVRAPVPAEKSGTAQPSDTASASAFFLRGRVVDTRRFAAPGVEVRLLRANGESSSVRSGEDGRFEFGIPERPEKWESITLWATRDETAVVRI